MEPKTAVSEKFFIVKRGKSRKGCIGRVEAETPHGEMIGLLYSGGSNAGTPKKGAVLKKEDTHPLTRHQAQLLLFVSSPSKRLELLCSPQLFLAICGLSQDDLVVVKHRKGYLPGLVKNLMQVVKKECKEDLHMLAFEVEFLEGDGDHKVSPMKPPLPLFSAADIIQVVPANSVPLGLHWRDGKGLNRKAVTRVKSMPSVGCHARQITETHTQPRVIQNRQLSISHAPLEVGSMVEVASNSGIIVYGVIRWLGTPGGQTDEWAGIELDYEVNGCSDGIHKDQRYFTCKGNRALFIPITKCSPDSRFVCSSTERETLKPIKTPPVPLYEDSGEDAPPVPETEALPLLVGRMKGIQGHINSCYLDATLFSLFSSSAAVDCICRKLADTERPITCTLRAIVNCLRRQGFVPAESVMNLRKQLGCDTFRKDEKDPEEFITVLFQKVLCMEPLLKLRSEGGISQGAYTLQIFLEKEQIRQMPTVQQLLDTSCLSADLKFETMPSCLIIQMPRFGNKYKMFPYIIPSVELDVTDLLYSSPRECFICGHLAEFECLQCLPDRKLQPGRIKQFCTTCCTQMHRHPARCGHSPRALTVPADVAADAPAAKRSMQLFAVLCIQTSHYVSFVKYGPAPHSWLFFDSMADRCGDDQSGYNIPEIRACPELGDFLCQSEEELVRANPSQTPELVRRLLCDSYMFLYHNPATALSNPNNGEP
ncbi:ubiquitin carboxyl-terminal hydrolase CYLD isoform X2 [Melanotaenia boesemani]|uniref:ubiquitin carboxyl-terminal hydrolase CYLD isoform X2 n=1 Tax=Melanotaenia boesemani TaxID=1250792 RepID=UPI001C04A5AC|nr:ubiquitin carboxyl-terminal hydrolase CYLD isoform X2 [Melanotaenia boesemani]